jgi:hypothetical protein
VSGKNDKGYPCGTPLAEFSILRPYLLVTTHRKSLVALLAYLATVIKDFFFLQFAVKWGWKKITVVSVDHPLDASVPFVPEKAPVYLDVFNFWTRAFSMTLVKLGTKRGIPYCTEFLMSIAHLYKEAARVYRFRMSTTVRPPSDEPLIKTIRRLDPHYLCVPSLHIAIAVLTFAFYRELLKKEAASFSAADRVRYANELYSGAVVISETVLYVKQHSVNCIPAALYLMCRIMPEIWTLTDAVEFIDRLFAGASALVADAGDVIRAHIHLLFERLVLEGFYSDDWTDPVKRWIVNYQAG